MQIHSQLGCMPAVNLKDCNELQWHLIFSLISYVIFEICEIISGCIYKHQEIFNQIVLCECRKRQDISLLRYLETHLNDKEKKLY